MNESLESSSKNKLLCHFSEEIFDPGNSKSLRLRRAAFEKHLSHVIWGSPFKRYLAFCGKIVCCLLKEKMQMLVYVMKGFFRAT